MTQDLAHMVITGLISREGGFSDHPADRGGPTKYGITHRTLAKWRGVASVTKDDVRNMPESEARAIYRKWYIEDPGFLAVTDYALLELLVDIGVNHGQGDAVRWLQRALNVQVDGVIGDITRAALARENSAVLYKNVIVARMRDYARILRANPSQREFAAGWMARAATFVERLPVRDAA